MIQNQPPSNPLALQLEKAQINCIELQEKERIRTSASTERYKQRKWINSYEKELDRHQYYDLAQASDGRIVEHINLPNAKPQDYDVCNIQFPTLTHLIRFENKADERWQVDASINGSPISVFLDPSRISSVAYIQQKFSASGISFYTNSFSSKREFALNLIEWLTRQPTVKTLYIYDTPGWYQASNNTFTFISQEEMTWKQLLQKTR